MEKRVYKVLGIGEFTSKKGSPYWRFIVGFEDKDFVGMRVKEWFLNWKPDVIPGQNVYLVFDCSDYGDKARLVNVEIIK